MEAQRFIYVVVGSTGEYSDWNEWIVAAYEKEEAADLHAELANDFIKTPFNEEYVKGGTVVSDIYDHRKFLAKTNPYDANCKTDYTGTEYEVRIVPLARHVDEYMEMHRNQ